MKRKSVRQIAIALSAMLLLGSFAGCGKSSDTSKKTESADGEKPIESITLPIVKEPIKIKYWLGLGTQLAKYYKNYDETPTYQELQKRTGIDIEFIHPAIGQEKEQFNLMVASNSLPDVIGYDFVAQYTGGPEKAIADNVIVPLNDQIAKYAPNLRKTLSTYKDVDKMVKTDSGKYYSFPSIRPDPSTLIYIGPEIRKDWMEELGLKNPETMDEWYTVLKVFKEKKKADAPLTFIWNEVKTQGAFAGAYGIDWSFYMDDNGSKIKFGPLQPGYKELVKTFAQWYKEGLIDPDFATNDRKAFEAKITGNKSGAFWGYASHAVRFMDLVNKDNPKYAWEGILNVAAKKGETPMLGHYSSPVRAGNGAYVTTANKYLKETTMLFDYGYSEEGNLLHNFGILNDSYTMVNGQPKYTDKIVKDPAGMSEGLNKYVISGPFSTDPRYFAQSLVRKEQADAINIWTKSNVAKYKLPPLTPSPEDASKYANIMGEINTYVDEMLLKFIIGQEPLTNFDKFTDQIKKMKIDDAIAIQQKALDAYNKR